MFKITTFLLLLLIVSQNSLASAADSPSNLLEKGIYSEETVGDLDKAIEIYKEIISQAKANRKFVAKAQFRLGKCLSKQGKKKEAEETFRKFIDEYKDSPDQEELVAEARGLLPDISGDLKLEKAPWVDGEHLELRIKIGSGVEIGDFILTARSGKVDGREVWNLGINRNIMLNSPNLGLSSVVVDRNTFRPLSSIFDHTLLGKIAAEYKPKQVTIRTTGDEGKETSKKLNLDSVFYDNEQGWHLFRRLPLAEKYKVQVPICSTIGAGPMTIELEVTGKETVEVPAGKFECYRVYVKPVQQTFWISTDAHRYAVKFEAGGIIGVLQSIRQVKENSTIEYHDNDLGFSVSAPADWYFVPNKISQSKTSKQVILVDPGAEGVNSLQVEPLDKLKPEHKASIRSWADHEIEDSKKSSKDFQITEGSLQERTVAGNPTVSFIATVDQGGKKKANYYVYMLGKKTALTFAARTSVDRIGEFRKKIDKVVETIKVK